MSHRIRRINNKTIDRLDYIVVFAGLFLFLGGVVILLIGLTR